MRKRAGINDHSAATDKSLAKYETFFHVKEPQFFTRKCQYLNPWLYTTFSPKDSKPECMKHWIFFRHS